MAGSGGKSRQGRYVTLKATKNVIRDGVGFSEGNQFIFRGPKAVPEARARVLIGDRGVQAMQRAAAVSGHHKNISWANKTASKSGWGGDGFSPVVKKELGPGKGRSKKKVT